MMYMALVCTHCEKYVHYTVHDIKFQKMKYDFLGAPIPETQLLFKVWIQCPWCNVKLINDKDIEIPEAMYDAACPVRITRRSTCTNCCEIL